MANTYDWASALKYARREAGMTQKQLAQRIGVAQSNVSAWENGQSRPTPESMEALREVLQIPEAADQVAPGQAILQKLLARVAVMTGDEIQQILLIADALVSKRLQEATEDRP